MNYGFIMTRTIYPLDEKKEILGKYYFDNPRTREEIKEVATKLKKINFIDNTPFPETIKQFGDEVISLESMLEDFYLGHNLDRKHLKNKKGYEYKDIYYKLATNWIILRFNDVNTTEITQKKIKNVEDIRNVIIEQSNKFLNNYENSIKYLNLLIYISFPNNFYKNNSYFLTDLFDLFDTDEISKKSKSVLIELLINTREKHNEDVNDFKFCTFDKLYEKIKENEKILLLNMGNPVLEFIANNMNVYNSITDDKMRIITLVSMIELLLTHNPDANRFNVEDSIRKQFSNKLTLVLYLNNKNLNYKETEKFLLLVYDLRSAIAHGSFDKINRLAEKIDIWLLNNSQIHKELRSDEDFDEEWIINNVNEILEKYFRIVLIEYLKDNDLFEILKK